MDAADKGAPPPPPLKLAWDAKRWGTLPESGGLYDQDYRTMLLMDICTNVYNAVSRVRNMQGEQIHQLTDGERKIIGFLRKEGML